VTARTAGSAPWLTVAGGALCSPAAQKPLLYHAALPVCGLRTARSGCAAGVPLPSCSYEQSSGFAGQTYGAALYSTKQRRCCSLNGDADAGVDRAACQVAPRLFLLLGGRRGNGGEEGLVGGRRRRCDPALFPLLTYLCSAALRYGCLLICFCACFMPHISACLLLRGGVCKEPSSHPARWHFMCPIYHVS